MVGTLLKWGGLLVICILVYNFFFGDSAEKESSRKIFGDMRSLVVSVSGLMKNEKAKFDAGKYDAVLDKLGGAYKAVRERAQFVDEKVLQRLDDLEQRKSELEEELQSIEQADQAAAAPAPAPKKGLKKDPKADEQRAAKVADQQRRKEELRRELEALLQDSDAMLEAAGK